MNVQHYFLGSPSFAQPPILIHLHTGEVSDPAELAALLELWQNPTYPEDSYRPLADVEAEARTKSMQRAQSPGILLCQVDMDTTKVPPVHAPIDSETYPAHIHTFSECMAYRAQQDIAPSDPWTYWSLYDRFPFPPQPPIFPSALPHGWNFIARVNPHGISEMNGWSAGWTGYTFATQIGASQILTTGFGPGTQTRVMIAADCVFDSLYIGPSTTTPFKAASLTRLKFGGAQTSIVVDGTYSDAGEQYTRLSDPLPQGFDATNGLIICGYVLTGPPGGTTAWLATRGAEPDWSCRYARGDFAATLDKSKLQPGVSGGWQPGGVADYAVFSVEGYYP